MSTTKHMIDRRQLLSWMAGGATLTALADGSELLAGSSTPSLFHPLRGGGTLKLGFGAQWVWGQCGGRNKVHCGVDLGCAAGTPVYAAYDGVVKAQFVDSGWKGCLVVEHRTPGGVVFTTTYWHLNANQSWVRVQRGERIGTVADLAGKTINHLHFGLRQAPYTSVAQRGALPFNAGCGDPAFPEKFVRPF